MSLKIAHMTPPGILSVCPKSNRWCCWNNWVQVCNSWWYFVQGYTYLPESVQSRLHFLEITNSLYFLLRWLDNLRNYIIVLMFEQQKIVHGRHKILRGFDVHDFTIFAQCRCARRTEKKVAKKPATDLILLKNLLNNLYSTFITRV